MITFIFKLTSGDSIVLIPIILGSGILVVGNTADTDLKVHLLLWLEAFGSTWQKWSFYGVLHFVFYVFYEC